MGMCKRIGQSVLAVLLGWLAGALCFLFYLPWAFVYMTGFVLPAWLFFVVPHYVLLSRESLLWNRWICPFYGALWGVTILVLYSKMGYHGFPVLSGSAELLNPWYLVAAGVTGFVTCVVASLQDKE